MSNRKAGDVGETPPSEPHAEPQPEPHHRVLGGRYRLDSPIGQGGLATVFLAHDLTLGRDVAVKLFHSSAVESGRQQTELTLLAGLDHHALVQIHDAGVDVDEYGRNNRYLVMALVNGSDLHERISHTQLTSRHIAEIGYDLAEALDYIQAKGVVHRDIKPSNILLVDYGDGSPRARAKLTDFGIAIADDMERLTVDGTTTGTAGYLSPEQASGKPITAASDVYSLGLVLLECFTRHLEFGGGVVESALARLSRDPVIPDDLPDYWQHLLAAMTARDPEARPVRHELVAALKQVVIAESGRHKDEAMEPLFAPGEKRAALTPRPSILDTLPDEALDRVTAMAARLFSAPISIVSVVDRDRVWFKSHYADDVDRDDIDRRDLERLANDLDLSTLMAPQVDAVVIEDGMLDSRTSDNVLVTGPVGMRFYVGVPLKRTSGELIGTLAVMDFAPSEATDAEVENLNDLAALVVSQLELRQVGLRTTSDVSQGLPLSH
ncbi:protein kinase domain-containing protein [Subtercola endophyticus]|uniref:protein kinase domain-containing protein n=1 Tax=Subtercola endophyticus TaxID=2895559 RepID=UPI001E5BBA6D|nr:GAF domain-containing serine/threonine-protein kinase [Subtercola endophyticus]UFS59833.1 protein kinase [Subtercola endophyticus]